MDKLTRFAVWLTDADLVARLKAEAGKRKLSLRAAVGEALRAWLTDSPFTVRSAAPPPRRRARTAPSSSPPMVDVTRARKPTKVIASDETICRRSCCRHAWERHWGNKCVAGCPCTRYLAP